MEEKAIARKLLPLLGGKENIESATHCATRLRLVLTDEEKAEKSAIENMDSVKGVFSNAGQFQIIFGTGLVNKIYKALVEESGITATNASHSEAMKKKMNPVARFAKTLSNIFVPIIPAIVSSGLLMGLLGMLRTFQWVAPDSAWIRMLDMFSSAAFIILPILIGYSAAKEFDGNPYLGAVIGGILTHPALLNPWVLGSQTPEYMNVLGFNVALIGYQGTVLPILLSVYFMSKLETNLRKVVPHSLDLLITPLVVIMFTGFVSLLGIGPLGALIGNGITGTLDFVYKNAGFMAGLLFGGLYSSIVITGLHHSFHAIEAGLLADPKVGVNFLLPIWSMANVAQGGAGLAVYFKTRNEKLKEIAIPAALTSFLGITEPVIFGVNLKLGRPFIGAAIGGALGSAYVVSTHVVANAYGLTGIPMLAIVAPLGMSNLVNYLIGFAIAVGSSFIATWFLGVKEEDNNSSSTRSQIPLS